MNDSVRVYQRSDGYWLVKVEDDIVTASDARGLATALTRAAFEADGLNERRQAEHAPQLRMPADDQGEMPV